MAGIVLVQHGGYIPRAAWWVCTRVAWWVYATLVCSIPTMVGIHRPPYVSRPTTPGIPPSTPAPRSRTSCCSWWTDAQ